MGIEELNETALVNMDDLASSLPAVKAPEVAEEAGRSYLPYINIVQGLSRLSQPPFQERIGSLILHGGKDIYENLGNEVDIFIVDVRHKAMSFAGNKVAVYFDKDSAEFQDVVAKADMRVPKYSYGYEFLIYIGSSGKFATIYCNNPSLRLAAGRHFAAEGCMRCIRTLKSEFIPYEKGDFWTMITTECETPLHIPPTREQLIEQIDAFQKVDVVMGEEEVEEGSEVLEGR